MSSQRQQLENSCIITPLWGPRGHRGCEWGEDASSSPLNLLAPSIWPPLTDEDETFDQPGSREGGGASAAFTARLIQTILSSRQRRSRVCVRADSSPITAPPTQRGHEIRSTHCDLRDYSHFSGKVSVGLQDFQVRSPLKHVQMKFLRHLRMFPAALPDVCQPSGTLCDMTTGPPLLLLKHTSLVTSCWLMQQ